MCLRKRGADSHHRIDVAGGRMLGREASRTLQQHGAMAVGPGGLVNLRRRGAVRFAELWQSLRGTQCVLWFDNYVRPKSYVDPARGFHMFDCTAFAVLKTSVALPAFRGMPPLADLFNRRRQLVVDLTEYHASLVRLLDVVRGMTFGANDVRVPLDVVRSTGHSPYWCPLAVSAECVTSQTGLVHALWWALDMAKHSLSPMPVCVDENIHYRLLKLGYGENTHRYDVRSVLSQCPPLYGVWHAYKYVVTVVHRVYFAHFVYLLHGQVDAGRTFPSSKHIRSLELDLAALLRLRTVIKDELHGAIVAAALANRDASTPVTRSRLRNLLALKCLLDVYAPVTFLLGWQARSCVWQHRGRGTGALAKEVVMGCLLVLLKLTEGQSHLVEYVRTMVCSLVCWTSWHSEVPGECYTDEANEASLAQLGRWWAQHSEVSTQQSLMDMYLLMPTMGRGADESRVSRPSAVLMQTVEQRLRSLLSAPRELVTYVPWSSASVCTAELVWPESAWFPQDLSVRPSTTYLSNLTKYALSRLVVQGAVSKPMARKLRKLGLQDHRDAQTLANDRIIGRIKADCPADMAVPKPAPAISLRAQALY